MKCSLISTCEFDASYRVHVETGLIAFACLKHTEEALDAGVPNEAFLSLREEKPNGNRTG